MATMNGRWKQDRAENLDDYMKAMGVNKVKRALVKTSTPVTEITIEGNHVTVKNTTTFSSQVIDCDVGAEFETTLPGISDAKFKCTAALAGEKLTITAVPVDAELPQTVTEREIVGDELLTTMTVGDVVCKRYFKKLS